jgi:DNA-binding LytR/AlgR family response regulator
MKTDFISVGGRMKFRPSDIVLMEADCNYTRLYLENGSTAYVATTMKILERRFMHEQNFFRSSKSYIINLNFFENFLPKENLICLNNSKTASVSRRKRGEFIDKLKNIA